MSLPYFPSTSGLKPSELHVYTIEECQSCKQKTKRDFKVGDYITGAAGVCEKCQGQKMIILIYGEKASALKEPNPHSGKMRIVSWSYS